MTKDREDLYYKHQQGLGSLISEIAWRVRKQMFRTLMDMYGSTREAKVLDVGATSYRRKECNFFEKLYSHTDKIVVLGKEDASFLEQEFPGSKFLKLEGSRLPFADKSFDLVTSFATIEHVGDREKQRNFINELCRVGRICCVTTPNRWYPIEFHTLLPFVHWFPAPFFRLICRCFKRDFYAVEENLNLLSERELINLFPKSFSVRTKRFRLFGLVSNLMFYGKDKEV